MANFTKALTVAPPPSVSKREGMLDNREFRSGGIVNTKDTSQTPVRVMRNRLTFPQMEQMYYLNAWVRAIVDKTVKRSVAVKPQWKAITKKHTDAPSEAQLKKIGELEGFLSQPNSTNESFDSIRTKLSTDILIWDSAGLEFVKNTRKKLTEMFSVSGDTIRVNVDRRGIFTSPNKAYLQKDQSGAEVSSFGKDDMAYFKQYPRSSSVYGTSPLESLRQTVTADLYQDNFNITRFINDATPRFALMFDGLGTGQGGAAMQRLREWWDSELRGQPHKPILIGSENGNIQFEKVGLSNEDMQFQEYSRWLLSKIMAVYRMQPAVLGVIDVNQGRINASYQEIQFKKDALTPLLTSISNQLNTTLVWNKNNFGWSDIYLDWEGLDDEDKILQAKIHEVYLRYGVYTINDVLEQLGMDGVPWGDIPYMFNQMAPLDQLSNNTSEETPPPPIAKGMISRNSYFDSFTGEFDIQKWLMAGALAGKVFPTGLERVERGDIKKAITKLKGQHESARSKLISIS